MQELVALECYSLYTVIAIVRSLAGSERWQKDTFWLQSVLVKQFQEDDDVLPCVTQLHEDADGVSVTAGPMQHTMPCVGYVLNEKRGADRLKLDAVEEVCPHLCLRAAHYIVSGLLPW